MTSPSDLYKHLSPGAIEVLAKSPQERIDWFVADERWVEYDKAKEVLARIGDLVRHPRIARMPSLLIVGESNSGKSSLLERAKKANEPEDTGDGLVVPVVCTSAPSGPDEVRLFNNILSSLHIPHRPNDGFRTKQPLVYGTLTDLKVRALLIDEIHNSLSGPTTKQKQYLNTLRLLSHDLKISIIAAGTREAARALAVDPQLANRFDPITLPQWKCDVNWQRLIVSFERLLPLPAPSNLGAAQAATKLHELTEGWIGELKKLLIVCLKDAILAGKSRIDSDILRDTKFVQPSKRRAAAESRQ